MFQLVRHSVGKLTHFESEACGPLHTTSTSSVASTDLVHVRGWPLSSELEPDSRGSISDYRRPQLEARASASGSFSRCGEGERGYIVLMQHGPGLKQGQGLLRLFWSSGALTGRRRKLCFSSHCDPRARPCQGEVQRPRLRQNAALTSDCPFVKKSLPALGWLPWGNATAKRQQSLSKEQVGNSDKEGERRREKGN